MVAKLRAKRLLVMLDSVQADLYSTDNEQMREVNIKLEPSSAIASTLLSSFPELVLKAF
jgi:hypothetical protein